MYQIQYCTCENVVLLCTYVFEVRRLQHCFNIKIFRHVFFSPSIRDDECGGWFFGCVNMHKLEFQLNFSNYYYSFGLRLMYPVYWINSEYAFLDFKHTFMCENCSSTCCAALGRKTIWRRAWCCWSAEVLCCWVQWHSYVDKMSALLLSHSSDMFLFFF